MNGAALGSIKQALMALLEKEVMIRILLENEVEINIQDVSERTALLEKEVKANI